MDVSHGSEAFLNEIKEHADLDIKEFREYQQVVQDTLKIFHSLCVKNQIVYYLAFGSLLGAIRDGEQIPWDYDIDLWVPLEEKDRLIKVLQEQLPKGYHFTTRFLDKTQRTHSIKIAPEEYDTEVLHLDVFWLFGEDSDPGKQKKNHKIRKRFFHDMLYRYTADKYLRSGGKVTKLYHTWKRIQSRVHLAFGSEKAFNKLLRPGIQQYEYCVYNGTAFTVLRSEWFGEPLLFQMKNGMSVYVPREYEKCLEKIYGDYMKVPSFESRYSEFSRSLARLRKLGRIGK